MTHTQTGKISGVFLPVDSITSSSQAYHCWKTCGLYQSVLVTLASPKEFPFIAKTGRENPLDTDISDDEPNFLSALARSENRNFLIRVFREKMVRKWYWLLPDPIWNSPHQKYEIWQYLIRLCDQMGGPVEYPRVEGATFRFSMWGVESIVGSLQKLLPISDEAVLYLSLSYFTTQSLHTSLKAEKMRFHLPWLWPEDLRSQLQGKIRSISRIVVSNALHDGTVSIHLRFLGKMLPEFLSCGSISENYGALRMSYDLLAKTQYQKVLNLLEAKNFEPRYEASAHGLRAMALAGLKKWEEAREAYQRAVDKEPEYGSIESSLALCFDALGRGDDAFQEFRRMKRLLPVEAWPRLGEAYYLARKKEWRQAVTGYLEVIAKNPNSGFAHWQVGEIYRQFRHFPKALDHLEKAARLGIRNIRMDLAMAQVWIHMGKMEAAKSLLLEALKRGVKMPDIFSLLGEVYLRQRRWHEFFNMFALECKIRFYRWWDSVLSTLKKMLSV